LSTVPLVTLAVNLVATSLIASEQVTDTIGHSCE
jgi:hypothetical protein